MKRAIPVFSAAALALVAAGVLLAQPGAIVVPPGKAILVVYAPADATVSVGGQVSAQKGPERRFVTPPLEAGSSYSYDIVATWKEGGKDRNEQRTVNFRAGEVKFVNLAQG